MEEIIIRGLIFCQVESSITNIHESPAITEGNQKCKGAAPNFRVRLRKNNSLIKIFIL